ncbi:MAG TPA: hypothetical protein HPQ00_12935, partial [Magnetococcales bacterium]|nr:hypothetical protein [Magnetococcales bacterium]
PTVVAAGPVDISGVGVPSNMTAWGDLTEEVAPEPTVVAAAAPTDGTAASAGTDPVAVAGPVDISGVGVPSNMTAWGDPTEEVTPEPTVTVAAAPAPANGTDISGVGVPSNFFGFDVEAETPSLAVTDSAGIEDQAIPLAISAALTDLDGSESLSVRIEGVPEGAILSSGVNMGNGVWVLTSGDLDGLTMTPAANSDNDFQLRITATSTESADGSQSSVTGTMNVVVDADADLPTLVIEDAAGLEDTAIPLNISAYLNDTDGSETLAITILEDVPQGAILSAGTNNGDGTWSLTAQDLVGLTIKPPANSGEDFTLTVRAISFDGGDASSVMGTIHVDVSPDADPPIMVLNDAAGLEDTAIALNIGAQLADTDGSETLAITILEDVPQGAILSAGTNNGDGTWSLTAQD